LQASLTEYK